MEGYVGIIVAVSACAVYFLYRKALPKPVPGVPFDEGAADSILGSLPAIIAYTKEHQVMIPWLAGMNKRLDAPLVQFFGFPFSGPTLILSDFRESQDILFRRTADFDRAQATIDGLTGVLEAHQITMRTADPRLKGNKELFRDLMSPNFLHTVSAVHIHKKSLALINLWKLKINVAGGKPFPARQDVFDVAFDMVNAAAFALEDDLSLTVANGEYIANGKSKSLRYAGDATVEFDRPTMAPDLAALKGVVDFAGAQNVSPNAKLTYYYAMASSPTLRRQMTRKGDFIKEQISKSLKRLESGDRTQMSATDYMVQREYSVAKKEMRATNVYSRRIIDELFGYIVAGHETTASTLSWALKYIADLQDVQTSLREVLRSAFKDAVTEGREPTAHEITSAKLPYMDAVVEETLRVGQPAPLQAREATRDTFVLGHPVPKGTMLLFNNSGPGYMSRGFDIRDSARTETSKTRHRGGVWDEEDMGEFKPERWLKTSEDGEVVFDPQAGPFAAFGLGPRSCAGRKLAYMEMRLMMTLLVWNFHFRKLDSDLSKYDTKEAVTVMPKTLYVGLEILELPGASHQST